MQDDRSEKPQVLGPLTGLSLEDRRRRSPLRAVVEAVEVDEDHAGVGRGAGAQIVAEPGCREEQQPGPLRVEIAGGRNQFPGLFQPIQVLGASGASAPTCSDRCAPKRRSDSAAVASVASVASVA